MRMQSVEVITEVELAAIISQREQVKVLTKELTEIKLLLEQAEQSVTIKLAAGVPIVGRFMAVIRQVLGQCRPKWKETYVGHMLEEHGMDLKKSEEAVKALTRIPMHDELIITETSEAFNRGGDLYEICHH